MKIIELYNKLKITPDLQKHMLRVAGLANIIISNLTNTVRVDKEAVIQACLCHDIAKILSFKTFKEGEQELQGEFKKIYGDNEHTAANRIVAEIPLTESAQEIIRANNHKPMVEKLRYILQNNKLELKILKYTDSRISPGGLVTLDGRWEEFIQRYPDRKDDATADETREILRKIEDQIQQFCEINLQEITKDQVEKEAEFMENTEI